MSLSLLWSTLTKSSRLNSWIINKYNVNRFFSVMYIELMSCKTTVTTILNYNPLFGLQQNKHIYIQGVPKKLCFTFLLISQLILIVEKRVGYPQNWHGKRLPTICDSTFSVTWFTRKLTFYEKFWPLLKGL